MNPLADLLLDPGRRHPEAPWTRGAGGRAWSYADLEHRSAALAHVLADRGVGPGDRVMVHSAQREWLFALHLGCVRSGAVHIPVNPAYPPAELAELVRTADPALLVSDSTITSPVPTATVDYLVAAAATRPSTYDDVPRVGADPVAMLFTSGTTGSPKCAVLSHDNLVNNARVLTEAWAFSGDDVLIHVLPLFHTHGLFVAAHCATASGASMAMLPSFAVDDVVGLMPSATVMMGVPTHYTRLLADPRLTHENTAGMRLFTSGSAPMLVATHREFTRRTGHSILERYGMTETCIITSNPLVGERRPGSVGRPLPGMAVRVIDGAPGQVEVRGASVFTGYWQNAHADAESFTPDGWFRTGDLGELDADGYLHLLGRSKELVISGGLNVYPKQVEKILDSLPGVLESAVVGLPDDDLGEVVTAALVAQPDAQLEVEVVRKLARAQLAGYQIPRRLLVMPELPRNAMGKVDKVALRSQLIGSGPTGVGAEQLP